MQAVDISDKSPVMLKMSKQWNQFCKHVNLYYQFFSWVHSWVMFSDPSETNTCNYSKSIHHLSISKLNFIFFKALHTGKFYNINLLWSSSQYFLLKCDVKGGKEFSKVYLFNVCNCHFKFECSLWTQSGVEDEETRLLRSLRGQFSTALQIHK